MNYYTTLLAVVLALCAASGAAAAAIAPEPTYTLPYEPVCYDTPVNNVQCGNTEVYELSRDAGAAAPTGGDEIYTLPPSTDATSQGYCPQSNCVRYFFYDDIMQGECLCDENAGFYEGSADLPLCSALANPDDVTSYLDIAFRNGEKRIPVPACWETVPDIITTTITEPEPSQLCGCDCKTYNYECEGNAVGVFSFTDGACGKDCEAACYGPTVPDMACTEDWTPVCGCDGVTYSNACYAKYLNGVYVFTEGACDDSTTATTTTTTTTELEPEVCTDGCEKWTIDGGCNSCDCEDGKLVGCTEKWCEATATYELSVMRAAAVPVPMPEDDEPTSYCLDDVTEPEPEVCPEGCLTWSYGCNSCPCAGTGVIDAKSDECTDVVCVWEGVPACIEFEVVLSEETCINGDFMMLYPSCPAPTEDMDTSNYCPAIPTCTCYEGWTGEFCDEEVVVTEPEPEVCTDGCVKWTMDDGCNSCDCEDGKLVACTEKWCEATATYELSALRKVAPEDDAPTSYCLDVVLSEETCINGDYEELYPPCAAPTEDMDTAPNCDAIPTCTCHKGWSGEFCDEVDVTVTITTVEPEVCTDGCAVWTLDAGCNTCECVDGELNGCTKIGCTEGYYGADEQSFCMDGVLTEATCINGDFFVAYPKCTSLADCEIIKSCVCWEGWTGEFCDEEEQVAEQYCEDHAGGNGCVTWFDGCNECACTDGVVGACTKVYCEPEDYADAHCVEEAETVCPMGCTTWFDGCNNCECDAFGVIGACEEMACKTMLEAECAEYESDEETNTKTDGGEEETKEEETIKNDDSGKSDEEVKTSGFVYGAAAAGAAMMVCLGGALFAKKKKKEDEAEDQFENSEYGADSESAYQLSPFTPSQESLA